MTAMDAAAAQTKIVTIIVNTRPHEWAEKKISFEQVVELAFPGQPYDPAGTLVEYSRGHGPDHSLRPGKRRRGEGRDGLRCRARQPLLTSRSPGWSLTATTWCSKSGHLVVRRLPYVGPSGLRADGRLVLPVNYTGGRGHRCNRPPDLVRRRGAPGRTRRSSRKRRPGPRFGNARPPTTCCLSSHPAAATRVCPRRSGSTRASFSARHGRSTPLSPIPRRLLSGRPR